MRHDNVFPISNPLCSFLREMWTQGWLDEYSEQHFLIKAIEGTLESFVGIDQMIANNGNGISVVNRDGTINNAGFNESFCIAISTRLQALHDRFGHEQIKNFIKNQLSAGKQNYCEDTFFEALSEVSVLTFFCSIYPWEEYLYEPVVSIAGSNRNPEARFTGNLCYKKLSENSVNGIRHIAINVEVKSPRFPHENHEHERIMIPTVLLNETGRDAVNELCKDYGVQYLPPRVLKIKDFINSAAKKFTIPEENELNLLFINWSYRDFPSNSFLEAWSLLTNEENGILQYPSIAAELGIDETAFQKISAIIVYTESLDGVMLSDFSFVWQRNGAGPRFRMWVLNETLRNAELNDESDFVFTATMMKPSQPLTQYAMVDFKSNETDDPAISHILSTFCKRLQDTIADNLLHPPE